MGRKSPTYTLKIDLNVLNHLGIDNARFITYDQLIRETQRTYADYIDASVKVRRLVELTESLQSDESWNEHKE